MKEASWELPDRYTSTALIAVAPESVSTELFTEFQDAPRRSGKINRLSAPEVTESVLRWPLDVIDDDELGRTLG